jgi:branched-chain amino acid transport system ATP-binding protein
MPILETKELTKQFGELTAVHRMDFEIEQGEIVGIIGPNGAGKTTFVNLLTGVLDATSGEIVFDGTVLGNSPVHSRAQSGLVRSFQIPQICDDLTLLENVRSAVLSRERRNNSLFSVLSLESESRDEAYELLETFGLADRADTEADTIPHGDKKILDVCMSVAMRPKLLVLDEPTSGVATDNKHEYFQTTDSAVLFIEHDMELIAEYAERVLAMDRGEKLAEGAPQEVLENEQVKRRIRGEEE